MTWQSVFIPILLVTTGSAALSPSPMMSSSDPGNRTSFDSSWLFYRCGLMPDGYVRPEPARLEEPSVDDGTWRPLDLPHDWAIEEGFRKDLPSNTGKLPWQGIGWYRKHFRVPSSDKGQLFFVDFDGAMSHARVWLNGHYLGEWPYGYASFRLEMTPYLRFDGDNVIAVRLENPKGFSRWYPGGGIYRNVWLVTTPQIHVAHWGIFVTTPSIDPEGAVVRVETEVENESTLASTVLVQQTIIDPITGKSVSKLPEKSIEIDRAKSRKSLAEATIKSPQLWDLKSPHLYTLQTSLVYRGNEIQRLNTPFGIRKAVFDPRVGFLLNGKHVRIKGVCDHHDLGPLGAAVNMKAVSRQIRILQEMGCNAVRTSHNPPAPELLDLCDRMGMLVLDESFDCWVKGKVPNDYSTLFPAWHEKDIQALVMRDRNHPCVIAWSCGNEIREQENGEWAGRLRAIFKRFDPTRPVTAACDNPQAGFDGFQDSVDIFGYNYKPHLYAKFIQAHPEIPLFGSETASCISSNGEYKFPVSDDKLDGAFNGQVSSYDIYAPQWATIPDVEFAAEDKNPAVAGEFVWTGFDYLGEPTPYWQDTSSSRSSYFGIVDLCGFKKDRFYLYQARWRPDLPMAHILPHWNWPGREGQLTPVHVYTSGDEAELFLNGHSLGKKKKGEFEYRIRWDSVRYEPGTLSVVAYKGGKEWARDVMVTTGSPAALQIIPEDSVIHADGTDLCFLRVVAVDNEGRYVPTAESVVRVQVTGPASLAAVANGDPTCMESFRSSQYPLFNGQCLVIIRPRLGEPGSIQVTGESMGLTRAGVTIHSQ